MEKNNLFRKASLDKVSSPEQLNEYIRVSRPSVWMVLCAALLLLAALLVWAAWGDLPTTYQAAGMSEGGGIRCLLPASEAASVKPGMAVMADGTEGRVVSVAQTPLSYAEALELVSGDYALSAMNVGDWSVLVEISAPGAREGVIPLEIQTESIRPIEFLLN